MPETLSFESARLRARISALLIALVPIIVLSISIPLTFSFNPSPNDVFYMGIISSIFNYAVYILFLSAMNGFAKYYNDPRIFKNSLYAFIVSASVGTIFLVTDYFFLMPFLEQLSSYTPSPTSVPPLSVILPMLQFAAIALIILLIVGILNGFFYRKSFNALAENSGQHDFRTAGLLMLLGGILMIILVGTLLFFVGWIFAIVGFFSMKPETAKPNSTQQAS